jgi:predicted metal-dependent hydrolase
MPLPDYTVRHSPKTRNIRLKVTPEDGLCVIVPRGYDETKIPAILQRKKEWIADALSRAAHTRRFLEPWPQNYLPETINLQALGETWAVSYRKNSLRRGITLSVGDGQITLSGATIDRTAAIRKLNDWLRLRVRDSLFPLAQQLADKHRLPLRLLLVKSQRTRWASCSAQKNLALNTKLLFLPPDLVRYVMTHELCHLREMNHSRQFWLHVHSICPDYRRLDARLRDVWKIVPSWIGSTKGGGDQSCGRRREGWVPAAQPIRIETTATVISIRCSRSPVGASGVRGVWGMPREGGDGSERYDDGGEPKATHGAGRAGSSRAAPNAMEPV